MLDEFFRIDKGPQTKCDLFSRCADKISWERVAIYYISLYYIRFEALHQIRMVVSFSFSEVFSCIIEFLQIKLSQVSQQILVYYLVSQLLISETMELELERPQKIIFIRNYTVLVCLFFLIMDAKLRLSQTRIVDAWV